MRVQRSSNAVQQSHFSLAGPIKSAAQRNPTKSNNRISMGRASQIGSPTKSNEIQQSHFMMPPTTRYETAWARLLCNGGAHEKALVIMFTFRKCVYSKFQVFYFPGLAHGSVRENKYLSFSVYPPRKFCTSAEFVFGSNVRTRSNRAAHNR